MGQYPPGPNVVRITRNDPLPRIRGVLLRLTAHGATKEDLILLLAQLEISRAENPDIVADALDLLEDWVSPHMQMPEPLPEPLDPAAIQQRQHLNEWMHGRSPGAEQPEDNLARQMPPQELMPILRRRRP